MKSSFSPQTPVRTLSPKTPSAGPGTGPVPVLSLSNAHDNGNIISSLDPSLSIQSVCNSPAVTLNKNVSDSICFNCHGARGTRFPP